MDTLPPVVEWTFCRTGERPLALRRDEGIIQRPFMPCNAFQPHVDFQMLAVDVPHVLVGSCKGSCKNAAHSHAVNDSNTLSCALQWRMKPSAPRTKVTIDLEIVTSSRTTSLSRISAKTLGRRYRPSRKTRLETGGDSLPRCDKTAMPRSMALVICVCSSSCSEEGKGTFGTPNARRARR